MLFIPAQHEIMLIHVWFSPRDLEPNGLWKSIFFPIYENDRISILQRIIVRMHLYKLLSTFYICTYVCMSLYAVVSGNHSDGAVQLHARGNADLRQHQRQRRAEEKVRQRFPRIQLEEQVKTLSYIHTNIHTYIHTWCWSAHLMKHR